MLHAVLYACFHPERGPSVIRHFPSTFTIASRDSENDEKADIDWNSISSYIIPAYELCDRSLSIRHEGYTILGFPVSLEGEHYERNRFTFNVCFVLSEDEDPRPWEGLVKKTALFFSDLEQDDGLLQRELKADELRSLASPTATQGEEGAVSELLETVFEDLNAYGETCARLDDTHVLNLRLSRTDEPRPPKVRSWEVPLLIRALPEPDEWTWDLVLDRMQPFINGVNHVGKISELADVEVGLVRKACRELVAHNRAVVLDLFHFQAHYILTDAFAIFHKDEHLQEECCKYISLQTKRPTSHSASLVSIMQASDIQHFPTKQAVLALYRAINPGLSVHSFVLLHEEELTNIDIRRFITFGVLKGFLRRVHKYALAIDSSVAGSEKSFSGGSSYSSARHIAITQAVPKVISTVNEEAQERFDRAWRKAALSSGWETPPTEPGIALSSSAAAAARAAAVAMPGHNGQAMEVVRSLVSEGEEVRRAEDEKLTRFLDGKHCLDEICVAMHMSERRIVERLRGGKFGEVIFFTR